jgi:hypothetical protein
MTKASIPFDKICNYCGKPFKAFQQRTLYCSHKCNQRAYKEAHRQEAGEKFNDEQVIKRSATRTNLLLEQILEGVKSINNQVAISSKPFLTPKEVCDLLSISRKTFDRLVQKITSLGSFLRRMINWLLLIMTVPFLIL